MTNRAVLGAPRDFVVVTPSAEASLDNVHHQDIVGSGTNFKSDFRMANSAAEANSMKPVRKNDWAHASFFGALVKDNVTVFCFCRW